MRNAGAVTAGAAAGVDITENVGVGGNGRAIPPIGSSTCFVMSVLYFTIASSVVGVLFKIIRLLC